MTTTDATSATRPVGWRMHLLAFWVGTAVVATVALWLSWDYANRVVEINVMYQNSDYLDTDVRMIDQKWQEANALITLSTPLYTAAALLAVLGLAVHARGWFVTRERARAALRGRPGH